MFGGAGRDRATYYYESVEIRASIDGLANDGIPSERVNVSTDVEDLEGGRSRDVLVGSNAANLILGNGGHDSIAGLNGRDTLFGNDGSDTLNGGARNDLLDGGAGPDRFIGGQGLDTADYSKRTDRLSLSLDELTNDGARGEFDKIDNDIEVLLGGTNADSIIGSGRNETLVGGSGKDTILGNGGLDSIVDA